MRNIFNFLKKSIGKLNKYYVTLIVFAVLTFFVGDSTLQKRYGYDLEINRLGEEILHYKKLNEDCTSKLKALRSDDESLEKYAREQFLMTKPNEELFIIR